MIYTTLLDGFVLIGVLFRRGLFVVATLGLHTHCRAVGCLTGTSLEQQVQHIFSQLGAYAAARFDNSIERMHGAFAVPRLLRQEKMENLLHRAGTMPSVTAVPCRRVCITRRAAVWR